MAAAGANILTCNLSYTVSSAARSGKPIFFIVARTGPLRQMLPGGRVRRHHGMNWSAQTTIEYAHIMSANVCSRHIAHISLCAAHVSDLTQAVLVNSKPFLCATGRHRCWNRQFAVSSYLDLGANFRLPIL